MRFLQAESGQCNLFGEFGWFVQALLGVLSFSSLIGKAYAAKRYVDKHRRSWKVWFMDTSKQALSAGMLHIINMIASYAVQRLQAGADECVIYFLNFMLDTLFGLGVAYLLLKALECSFARCQPLAFKSGSYGNPPAWCSWFYQVSLWLCICLFTKAVILLMLWLFHMELEFLASLMLSPVTGFPELELLLVVIIIPVILNITMFWITDSFIKRSDKPREGDPDYELWENDLVDKLTEDSLVIN